MRRVVLIDRTVVVAGRLAALRVVGLQRRHDERVAIAGPVCVKGSIRSRFGCSGSWPGAG
jgi:hypothetical protein